LGFRRNVGSSEFPLHGVTDYSRRESILSSSDSATRTSPVFRASS